MDDGDHAWVMAAPSSTYQQLLTVEWVPKQLLRKAVFNTFIFEGGWGVQKSLTRRDPKDNLIICSWKVILIVLVKSRIRKKAAQFKMGNGIDNILDLYFLYYVVLYYKYCLQGF